MRASIFRALFPLRVIPLQSLLSWLCTRVGARPHACSCCPSGNSGENCSHLHTACTEVNNLPKLPSPNARSVLLLNNFLSEVSGPETVPDKRWECCPALVPAATRQRGGWPGVLPEVRRGGSMSPAQPCGAPTAAVWGAAMAARPPGAVTMAMRVR